MTLILNWLKSKLINRDNGIILESHNLSSFSVIQDFIKNSDRSFKTPVIYYQAFPEESAVEFLNTLGQELASKMSKTSSNLQQSLLSTIEDAELKMIVIDNCHLHPQDTMQYLIDFFSVCGVAVMLVGEHDKMAIAQILTNPQITDWDRFEVARKYKSVSELR